MKDVHSLMPLPSAADTVHNSLQFLPMSAVNAVA